MLQYSKLIFICAGGSTLGALQPHGGTRSGGASAGQTPARFLQQPEAGAGLILPLHTLARQPSGGVQEVNFATSFHKLSNTIPKHTANIT